MTSTPRDLGAHRLRQLATALALDVHLVPVLVGTATMPAEEDLPHDIRGLAARQAIGLSDEHWDAGLQRLVDVLRSERPPREPRPPVRG